MNLLDRRAGRREARGIAGGRRRAGDADSLAQRRRRRKTPPLEFHFSHNFGFISLPRRSRSIARSLARCPRICNFSNNPAISPPPERIPGAAPYLVTPKVSQQRLVEEKPAEIVATDNSNQRYLSDDATRAPRTSCTSMCQPGLSQSMLSEGNFVDCWICVEIRLELLVLLPNSFKYDQTRQASVLPHRRQSRSSDAFSGRLLAKAPIHSRETIGQSISSQALHRSLWRINRRWRCISALGRLVRGHVGKITSSFESDRTEGEHRSASGSPRTDSPALHSTA